MAGCSRDFEIELKPAVPMLVVEGYINTWNPLYNYVILGRSQDFYDTAFSNVAVSNARVFITEGTYGPNDTYSWDATTRRQMREIRVPQLGNVQLPGVYFDPRLASDPGRSLRGTAGKHYLLEIETDGKQYTATTHLVPVVRLDSVTVGNYYNDEEEGHIVRKALITVHYKDPDTIGNSQLYFWQYRLERRFGWGSLHTNRYTPGTDDLVNGQYLHITHGNGLNVGDTITYHLASVERKVYNFWDSFNKARSNGGPFSTPVTLQSTISGENVTGCFSGFSVSSRRVAIRE
ncbi:DUF4249 domain-containing protein [Paraflavitalea pollutisoli]|uniref:DUF4249 domain-containing protein n=1 Tax=Paraflavitalea pollutisoli TaxID=3034143 RepID=UPI0023EBC6A3|nr:DUF4249 domain-containing protein [Paraflavitalea sp. H1-2-19X]